ncbi:hypothetical protein ACFL3P_05550 [Pseudomonadota bacterium]
MSSVTVYVFYFSDDGIVTRIPYSKWKRIKAENEPVEAFSNSTVYIAYAYILLKNRKPDYCPHIEGGIYYFDQSGRMVSNEPYYFDLLQDLDEAAGGVIDLQHRKKKKQAFEKYCWELNSQQVRSVIDCIW